MNEFIGLGREAWREARQTIQDLFSSLGEEGVKDFVFPIKECQLHLPVQIGDYTDFYASKEHATNVGTMFRGKENALQPNWLHMPIGYHGRASSVVVSGTPIVRPKGQVKPPDSPPVFQPSSKMDFELEMAFVVGKTTCLGAPISVDDAPDAIFGVVLMNDWSARDIQAWEYVPLGPFLGKSFATTVSPWIVTMDALEPFAAGAPKQSPQPLPYLLPSKAGSPDLQTYDVSLTVSLQPKDSPSPSVISSSNLKHLYWTFGQMLAHHSINGCNMRVGDLCGTGTISGATDQELGSLLELSWNAARPVALSSSSSTRTFLQDGDTVVLQGVCVHKTAGYSIGFGECTGQLAPSRQ